MKNDEKYSKRFFKTKIESDFKVTQNHRLL